jgi:hypothetical protein
LSENPGKKDDGFDLSPELEGYISLDEARVLALQHARHNREVYGRYSEAELVFEVVDRTREPISEAVKLFNEYVSPIVVVTINTNGQAA